MINLEWARSFLVFSEHLNFTRAAEALNLSQPALHVQIRKLSEDLGVTLYRRAGRSLVLTQEGLRVVGFAREMLERCDHFSEELLTGQDTGPVVLVAGEGAFLYLLDDAIRRFSHESPARLLLRTANAAGVVDALLSGKAHLGIAVPQAVPDDLVTHPFARVSFFVVMPADHHLASRHSLTPGDLEGESLILPPLGRPHRHAVSSLLEEAGVKVHVNIEANGWELMVHFAALGLGVAVVNDHVVLPPGVVGVPFVGLPVVVYRLIHKRDAVFSGNRDLLRRILLDVACNKSP